MLWVKQSSIPVNLNFDGAGGEKGVYTSVTCSGLSLGAENGEDGKFYFNYIPFISEDPFVQTKINVGTDTLICVGDTASIFADIISSVTPNFDWFYNSNSISTAFNLEVGPTIRGVNRYTATAVWQVFDQNCLEEKNVNISVRNPDICIVSDPSTPVEVGNPVFLNAVINPINANYTYSWLQDYVMPNNDRNAVVEPFETTNFCITVTDEINCQKTECVEVPVILPPSGAPNAFTPNNDGVNDTYRIIPEPQLRQTSLKIYNRWGEIIYNSNEIFEWDGNVNGQKQAVDYYTWTAEFEHRNTKEITMQSGTFNLIR